METSQSAENLLDLLRLGWVETTLESPQHPLRRASLLSDMVIAGFNQPRSSETPDSPDIVIAGFNQPGSNETPDSPEPEKKKKRVLIYKDDDNGSQLAGEVDVENWSFSDDKTGISGFYHRLPKFYWNFPVIRNIEEDGETIRVYFAKKGRIAFC